MSSICGKEIEFFEVVDRGWQLVQWLADVAANDALGRPMGKYRMLQFGLIDVMHVDA